MLGELIAQSSNQSLRFSHRQSRTVLGGSQSNQLTPQSLRGSFYLWLLERAALQVPKLNEQLFQLIPIDVLICTSLL